MIIDNQTKRGNNPVTVYEFIKQGFTDGGNFDIVTAYFTIKTLAKFYDEFNKVKKYRIIIGDFMNEKKEQNKIIDLLTPDFDIKTVLELGFDSKKAVKFLQQKNVKIKTVKNKLCHAKAYIFDANKQNDKDNFFVTGSSNFTYSGLKINKKNRNTNIELNLADTGLNSDFKVLKNWYEKLWIKETTYKIKIEENKEIYCKDYLIDNIKKYYKEYSPFELYYKVLFEMFRDEFEYFEKDSITIENIKHLKDTVIYKKLYGFQETGVLSLIKKLQLYKGAILADAVGLGKTWQALALLKYFSLQGHKCLVIVPKKLRHNWDKYREAKNSLFEADKLQFFVRHHTDLQINPNEKHRLNNYKDYKLDYFQKNSKIFIVIDESHNFRNDKSNRYNYLVEHILSKNKDVKVLLLSATPINNYIKDLRNQFKLLVKGNDRGFENTKFEIKSLQSLFRTAQEKIKNWNNKTEGTVNRLISQLPQDLFELTDEFIVARTRKLIEQKEYKDKNGEIVKFNFPQKEKPENIFVEIENIENLKTFDEILNLIEIDFTAYKPAHYIEQKISVNVMKDEKLRQKFLVKMMYILMVKRMESSWFSFRSTVKNILKQHEIALEKIENFYSEKEKTTENIFLNIENNIDELKDENRNFRISDDFEIGKKNPVNIADITEPEKFKKDLKNDIRKLKELMKNLDNFAGKIKNEKSNKESKDEKLKKLMKIINEKQKSKNKKLIVFTAFADTSNYIYEELKKRKFSKIAMITGSKNYCEYKTKNKNDFELILQRFAPYTKLYKERKNDDFYKENKIKKPENFNQWKNIIPKYDKETYKKLTEPINILIATDTLSEGQNLQDCDTIVNYDVHWNPVRLIQRFGRIDRIGSPNKKVKSISFWPAKNLNNYLKLKTRIENKLALMTIAGSEIVQIDEKLEKKIKDNQLITKQEENMLKQMQISWEDIEKTETKDKNKNLQMNDFSLEEYRQDLYNFIKSKKEELEKIPNSVFTGFKLVNEMKNKHKKGILILIAYPRKPKKRKNFIYTKKEIIYIEKNGQKFIINNNDALNFLRKHKLQKTYLPEIENQDKKALLDYIELIQKYFEKKVEKKAEENIKNLFQGTSAKKKKKEKDGEKYLEDIYNKNKWDLITWFAVHE